MGIDITEFSQYPICDTDIWVKLCLGGILKELFFLHKKIIVADVVEGEIMKWQSNPHFSKIATEFQRCKRDACILVIQHDVHIVLEEKKLLERILLDLGFSNDFGNKPPEENKGEYVSAIYADYFGITLMRSNDHAFQEGGRGRIEFPDLVIKNWSDTLRDLIRDDRQRIAMAAKVEEESKRMNQHKKQYEAKKTLDAEMSMDLKLEQLLNKYSKRY